MLLNKFLFINKKKNFFLAIISFFPIFIWFLIFGNSILSQPYVWDDLHVFRNYSYKELIEVWYQNWFGYGPDNIETPAYRPLALWWYHLSYVLFGENVILHRIFLLFLMYFLIYILNKTLINFEFNRYEITLLTLLIVFSKIFTTLIAFFSVSPLIICYIFAILSINSYLKFEKNKKISSYLFSIFFCIISVLIREELYVLPLIIFLLYFIKFKLDLKNILFLSLKIIPFFIVVFTHYLLRKKFVLNADNFYIKDFSIYFGDKILGFGNIIKVIKASFFPMGYPSINNYFDIYQYSFSIIWFLIIFISFVYCIYKFKISNNKKHYILFLTSIVCTFPHITIARSFGIFLPSVFMMLIISSLILKLIEKNMKKLAFFIILLGISGGIYRSYLHIKSMNEFAVYIVRYDSQLIYLFKDVTIPKDRKNKKILHLNKLNVYQYEDDPKKYLDASNLIKSTKFNPESF